MARRAPLTLADHVETDAASDCAFPATPSPVDNSAMTIGSLRSICGARGKVRPPQLAEDLQNAEGLDNYSVPATPSPSGECDLAYGTYGTSVQANYARMAQMGVMLPLAHPGLGMWAGEYSMAGRQLPPPPAWSAETCRVPETIFAKPPPLPAVHTDRRLAAISWEGEVVSSQASTADTLENSLEDGTNSQVEASVGDIPTCSHALQTPLLSAPKVLRLQNILMHEQDAVSSYFRECAATKEPRLGSPELPSVGSLGHYLQRCKPCAFVNKMGCGNGTHCSFCHLCGPGEKKRRQKEKRSLFSAARRLALEASQQQGLR